MRTDGRPLVIGHRGAAAVAPENTLESLQAAVAAGADVVEFDIGADLRLAHSSREAPERQVSLDVALEYLRRESVGVHLDVKRPGYEAEIVRALHDHDLVSRAVLSTAYTVTARRLSVLIPEARRAIGYPHDRLGVSRLRWPAGLTRTGAAALRAAMPARVPLLLAASRADVLALHHTLCSGVTVRVAHARGVPVFAWTANEPATVRRLEAMGVDGIVSDDPGMALATLRTP